MKAILFDLDDTLYPEITFVKSGFKAVAAYLCQHCQYLDCTEQYLLDKLLLYLQSYGRGKTFDYLLRDLDLSIDHYIPLLIYIYRTHVPDIKLYPNVVSILQNLKHKGFSLGIITDGMASVQRRKIEALKLEKLLDLVICTDEIGRHYWKPSPIPYKIALDYLNTKPVEAVYVGNDITKDFAGANAINMHTIQVKHADIMVQEDECINETFKAKHVIYELQEIFEILNRLWTSKIK